MGGYAHHNSLIAAERKPLGAMPRILPDEIVSFPVRHYPADVFDDPRPVKLRICPLKTFPMIGAGSPGLHLVHGNTR